MDLPVTYEHFLFPAVFQTHADSRSGLATTRRQADLEMFLKAAILMCRSVVVADADLNNNPVFYSSTASGHSVLRDTIEAGFVRRAVRNVSGGRVSQESVAASLRTSDQARFDGIPPRHPKVLDRLFGKSEDEHPPVEWDVADLGQIFGDRLVELLREESHRSSANSVKLRLVEAAHEWVLERRRRYEPIAAARLGRELRPTSATAHEAVAWDEVWSIVLHAYRGNVPIALRGQLIQADNAIDSDRFMPAGPESTEAEHAAESWFYSISSREPSRAVVECVNSDVHFDVEDLEIDPVRLSELSVAELIDLRDQCEPDSLFDLRHHGCGSAASAAKSWTEYSSVAASYAERLIRTGRLLTENGLNAKLLESARSHQMQQYFVGEVDPEGLAKQLALTISGNPLQGSQIVTCDLNLLARLRPDLRLPSASVHSWRFKRPDYRLIRRIGEQDPNE